LNERGYSLQANVKTKEAGSGPEKKGQPKEVNVYDFSSL